MLFDGIEAVLAAIEAAGARWGIVTNKPEYLATKVVADDRTGASAAQVLIGGDTLPRKKPEPDQLLLACEAIGVSPGECVYVGDDERDIVRPRVAPA